VAATMVSRMRLPSVVSTPNPLLPTIWLERIRTAPDVELIPAAEFFATRFFETVVPSSVTETPVVLFDIVLPRTVAPVFAAIPTPLFRTTSPRATEPVPPIPTPTNQPDTVPFSTTTLSRPG